MNIGEFKTVSGQLLGSISTAAIHLPRLGLRPVQSDHARAPKFEVVLLNSGRRWVQIGAVWEAKSNSTGEFFLQGSVDDPSFPAPLQIACFGNEDGYRVAWTRNRRRQNGFGQSDNMGPDNMGPENMGPDTMGAEGMAEGREGGDGFEGNASEDGSLISGGEAGNDGQAGEGGEPQTSRRGPRAQQPEEAAPAF